MIGGAVLVVVPLAVTQRLPERCLIPHQRAVEQLAAKVLGSSQQNLVTRD